MLSGIFEKIIANDPGLMKAVEEACNIINNAGKKRSKEQPIKEPSG